METYEAIMSRRTIRKFRQDKIGTETLKRIVNAGRLAAQGANMQPMKYIIVQNSAVLEMLFEATAWAAYIKPQGNPAEGERPVAYIVALADTHIKKTGYDIDAGAAIENILIAAAGEGIGTCWLGAINRDKIREILSIPERFAVHSLIALGYPAEQPVIEDEKGSIKYYMDEHGVLHVPKRRLEDVILEIR
jgi:nitroreductase